MNIKHPKAYVIFITLILFMTVIPLQGLETSGGHETVLQNDPIEISTVEELQAMKDDLSADYVLVNDIDASETRDWNDGKGFEPVGCEDSPFIGNFDGRDYTISGLYINRPDSNDVGLFGYIGWTELKNLGLINNNITGEKYVGGLVGRNEGAVEDSYATGTVSGNLLVAGLVGRNEGAVEGSYTTGSVSGGYYVGGLVGFNNGGTVSNSHSIGNVTLITIRSHSFTPPSWGGGLIGHNDGKVFNSFAVGNITGRSTVGGLIGRNMALISNSYAKGNISGTECVGGLVGSNQGNISNSYFTGNTSGSYVVGGFVGINEGIISNSYITGSVEGDRKIGGLVGVNWKSTVENSHATGTVSGNENVGGLVGVNEGAVENSYATGSVSGEESVGGLVGVNEGTVKNSFYDIDSVMINDGHYITIGGIFNEQYEDWFNKGMQLNISDYADTLVPVDDHYEISSRDGLRDLLGFADRDGYEFHLAADIDMSDEPDLYVPYIVADFNGNNYTISNLHINIPFAAHIGLFGCVGPKGTVRNLGVVDANLNGFGQVGVLVGTNAGTIENSYATGYLSGGRGVGGLVGYNDGNVEKSYATVNVSGERLVGGLVGSNRKEGTVFNSYTTGSVSGRWSVGGLVGWNEESTVEKSYATGDVSGDSNVGGLVGSNLFEGTVQNSYAKGTVTRKSDSTSTDFGGFVGRNFQGKIINCYSTGSVHYEDAEDPTNKGFAGSVDTSGDYNMNGNFWDVETSGQNETAGDATGLNTAEMQTRSTYIDAGWDFDEIWEIEEYRNDGYPYLQWQEFEEEEEVGRPVFLLVAVVIVIFIALILFMVAVSGKSDEFDQN